MEEKYIGDGFYQIFGDQPCSPDVFSSPLKETVVSSFCKKCGNSFYIASEGHNGLCQNCVKILTNKILDRGCDGRTQRFER